LAVPTDGSEPPQLVETNTAFGFDWSADGHSLLYVHGLLESTVLGSLTRRGILNAAGKIDIQTNADDLANLLFDGYNKVRCLSNGRIIFAAMEIHLPCTEVEMPKKHQLFALDPERQAVIPLILGSVQDRLPDDLAFYEISPDGQQIAMSGNKGPVLVLNLATGALDTVQAAGIADAAFVPVWRSSGELCFNLDTNGQPSQVALWSNGTNRVLSATWPPEARKGFLGNFATNGQPAQAALWSNGTNRVLSTNWPPKAVKGFLEK
jgi:hypothetical protein